MENNMNEEIEDLNPAKIIMHSAFDTVLSQMRTVPVDQLSYLLGRFDSYHMMSDTLKILNADELAVLHERCDAIPAERTASGLDS
jgi:hypothetical protein